MIEDKISQSIFNKDNEKTYVDKLLAKDDVNNLREIIKKPKLSREDILDILYLLTSSESKLYNFNEWDRYVILKFFVWLREFVKVAEQLFDYEDKLIKKNKEGKFNLSNRARELLENNKNLIEHNIKFLVDLYLNIGRTSLSLNATAFTEILNNKYEITYPTQQVVAPEKKGLLSWGK
jgi:hypothetical protein